MDSLSAGKLTSRRNRKYNVRDQICRVCQNILDPPVISTVRSERKRGCEGRPDIVRWVEFVRTEDHDVMVDVRDARHSEQEAVEVAKIKTKLSWC
jgi:hypothetical protein